MKTIRRLLSDREGSSIVSVLVAFIILLLGIGAFAAAIGTANEMVRRAEVLNIATGQVLEQFYQDYAMTPVDNQNFVTPVKRVQMDEEGNTTPAAGGETPFRIHTKLRKKQYDLTIEGESGGSPAGSPAETKLEYEMYYYK